MLKLIADKIQKILSLLAGSLNRTGILQVEPVIRHSRPDVDNFTISSVDFGDKTTWFQNSIRETDSILTRAPHSDTTYLSSHTNWIDIENSKLTAPNKYTRSTSKGITTGGVLSRSSGFVHKCNYNVVVKVNNEVVPESEYTIDFRAGSVYFNKGRSATDIVRATYSYANPHRGSEFIVHPPNEDRFWAIEHTELQISQAVQAPMPHVVFQLWGGKEDFNYNFDDPTQIAYYCLYEQVFRTPVDYINIGNEGKGCIPAFSNLRSDVIVFPFNYMNSICVGNVDVPHKLVRLYVDGENEFQGTDVAGITFYLEDRPLVDFKL